MKTNKIILSVLILIIFLSGVTLLLRYGKDAEKNSSEWITYTNIEYGFELKHLSAFVLHENKFGASFEQNEHCEAEYDRIFYTPGGVIESAESASWPPRGCFGFSIFISPKEPAKGGTMERLREQIIVNDVVWVKISSTDDMTGLLLEAQTYKNGLWYTASSLYNIADKVEAENQFFEILRTFKFLDSGSKLISLRKN